MMLSGKYSWPTILLVFLFATLSCTKDKPSDIQKESFLKNFGGAFEDAAIDFIANDGNYYVLGNVKDENDNTRILVTKTDDFGNTLWAENYPKNDLQENQSVGSQIIKLEQQAGYAIIGSIEMDQASLYYETYFLIFNEDGDVLKENVYENLEFNDYGKCIAELENGNFSLSGVVSDPNQSAASKIYFIDTNPDGISTSEPSTYPGTDLFQICKKTVNNRFYLTAFADIPKIFIIEPDGTTGSVQDHGSIDGKIKSIVQDKEGRTFICGVLTKGSNGKNDGFIAELVDAYESVEYLWLKEFGGTGDDYFEHISLTSTNEILVTGSYENTEFNTHDIWILKTDRDGTQIAEDIIGGVSNEFGIRTIEADNARYIIEATTYFEKNASIALFKNEFE